MDKCLDYFVFLFCFFLPEADILILYNISELFWKLPEEENNTVCTCFKDIVFGYM